MLQTIRSHMTGFANRKERLVPFRQHGTLSPPSTPELNYRNSQALLVTKVNAAGQEMPIAIAFVQKKSKISIYHLSELSEDT